MPPKTQWSWDKLKSGLTSMPTADLLATILVVVAIITIAAPDRGSKHGS